VFRTIDTAFGMFYNTVGDGGIVGKIRDALLVAVLLGGGLAATVGAGIGVSFVSDLPLNGFIAPLLLVIPLVLAFLPVYYVFPDTDVTVREVLPGTVVAAVGWVLLQTGFQVYMAYGGGQSQVYGVLGASLLVFTWLYLAALVLLVGVAVNVVLGNRTRAALASPPSRTDVSVRLDRSQ
jgi:membrane protein